MPPVFKYELLIYPPILIYMYIIIIIIKQLVLSTAEHKPFLIFSIYFSPALLESSLYWLILYRLSNELMGDSYF